MNELKYTAKQMRERCRVISPIYNTPIINDINKALNAAYVNSYCHSVSIDLVSDLSAQQLYRSKDVKNAIKLLRKNGFSVNDCGLFLIIKW